MKTLVCLLLFVIALWGLIVSQLRWNMMPKEKKKEAEINDLITNDTFTTF